MRFPEIEALLRRHRTASVLAGLLLVFAGVDLLFNPPKGQFIELFGIPFLVAGLSVLALVFRRTGTFGARPPDPRVPPDRAPHAPRLARPVPARNGDRDHRAGPRV